VIINQGLIVADEGIENLAALAAGETVAGSRVQRPGRPAVA
jgi:hypothetical protein